MKGSASGFRSSAWKITPALESDAPTSKATMSLGRRIRRTMSASGPCGSLPKSALMTCSGERPLGPSINESSETPATRPASTPSVPA
jgi:hypothetical protein